jgi:hypothetical protein
MGANGQYTALPSLDVVVAHKVDIDRSGKSNVTPEEYTAVLYMLIAARGPMRRSLPGSIR